MRRLGRQIDKSHRASRLSRSNHIQSRVDRRPPQVALFILQNIRAGPPTEQAQKHGLRHVLGVRRVPRDPVRCAEHRAVIRLKNSIEFGRDRDCPFLCQCALQGTLLLLSSPLKTAGGMSYYNPTNFYLEAKARAYLQRWLQPVSYLGLTG